jgi:hypothetical protein
MQPLYSRCSLFAMNLRVGWVPVNPADYYASFTTIKGCPDRFSRVFTLSQRHDYVRLELRFHEIHDEPFSF